MPKGFHGYWANARMDRIDKTDKIPADISKKCIDTLHVFSEEKRKNPQLDFERFLEKKGIKPPEPKAVGRVGSARYRAAV